MRGSFCIKVSDILLHSGSNDTISFVNIFSTKLKGLTKEGITTTVRLENLNKSEILVTLETVDINTNSVCDRCGCEFVYHQTFEDCSIQARVNEGNLGNSIEDVLVIDPKDLCVDIEDFIIDQIYLLSPIKIVCSLCENKVIDNDNEVDTSIIWK